VCFLVPTWVASQAENFSLPWSCMLLFLHMLKANAYDAEWLNVTKGVGYIAFLLCNVDYSLSRLYWTALQFVMCSKFWTEGQHNWNALVDIVSLLHIEWFVTVFAAWCWTWR
jgi:hypothetical protein